ncbi:hypothetical protein [Limimaricola litoreus]|nr:hypothetical protein [Limimaricola litoreus]
MRTVVTAAAKLSDFVLPNCGDEARWCSVTPTSPHAPRVAVSPGCATDLMAPISLHAGWRILLAAAEAEIVLGTCKISPHGAILDLPKTFNRKSA